MFLPVPTASKQGRSGADGKLPALPSGYTKQRAVIIKPESGTFSNLKLVFLSGSGGRQTCGWKEP